MPRLSAVGISGIHAGEDVKEKYAKDGDELLKGFKSALGKAVNRAGKEHAKLKGKDPEFDSEEMIEGAGGFLEPGDDGIK